MKSIPIYTAIISLGIFFLCNCNSGNKSPKVNEIVKNESSDILPSDSISVPIFAIWNEKETGNKYDGLYDSISNLFKYCKVNKTQRVNHSDVTIENFNECSQSGPMTPFMCVIKVNDTSQFCKILAFDSITNNMLLLTAFDDTVIASIHKLLPIQKEKIKFQINKTNLKLNNMEELTPMLKNDSQIGRKRIMHKSFYNK